MRTKTTTEGYVLIYVPDHPFCMKSNSYRGWAFEHRYIIEKELGRKLDRNEHVHHIDKNKSNNTRSNLEIIDAKAHTALHHPAKHIAPHTCKQCGATCVGKYTDTYCSHRCATFATRKVERPSKEALLELITTGMPATAIGEQYGVSDTAVKKWAKSYGII